jgi:hypothetical protein
MDNASRGVALADVLVATALIVSMLGIAVPALLSARERGVARLAARQVASRIQLLRLEALKRNASVAWRFDPTEVGLMATLVDGDGDGVRQADVDAGIDRAIARDVRLAELAGEVAFRIARDVPSPDSAGILAAGSDPIRIGASNFLTFGPTGGTSSGTLYLAGRDGPQVCVRLFGATGRVRVLWFDEARATWRHD